MRGSGPMVFHFRPDAASGSGEGGWGDIEGEGRGEGETIGGEVEEDMET